MLVLLIGTDGLEVVPIAQRPPPPAPVEGLLVALPRASVERSLLEALPGVVACTEAVARPRLEGRPREALTEATMLIWLVDVERPLLGDLSLLDAEDTGFSAWFLGPNAVDVEDRVLPLGADLVAAARFFRSLAPGAAFPRSQWLPEAFPRSQ